MVRSAATRRVSNHGDVMRHRLQLAAVDRSFHQDAPVVAARLGHRRRELAWVVRLDHPDESVFVHGVVAHDRSAALYSLVSMSAAAVSNPGRLRFPGLDPDARYLVEPLPIGSTMNHMQPAPWWQHAPLELSGAALGSAGLVAPLMRPEQGVLFRVTRVGE